MADIKVSQLAIASTATKDDTLMIVQGGVSKKLTLTTLLNNMDSASDIRINPSQQSISLIVSSKTQPNLLKVDGVNEKVGVAVSSPQELLHVGGNIKIDGIFRSSSEVIGHSAGSNVLLAPISILTEISALDIYGASTYTLSDGFEGQVKYIYAYIVNSGATATISIGNFSSVAGTGTIVFNAVGQAVQLLFDHGKWICTGYRGATVT